MAADLNIDEYLAALSRRWHGRHDRDMLLDEVEDHLRSTTEAAIARGDSTTAAEAETIARFGEPHAIADALADANGSPALPTAFTHVAGAGALAAAAAWLAVPAFWRWSQLLDETQDWTGAPMAAFLAGVMCLSAATVLGLVLVLALRERHGGLGWPFRIALGAGVIAMPAVLIVGWFTTGWETLLSIVWVSMAAAMLRRRIAPVAPTIAAAMAWPAALMTTAGLRTAGFGTYDEWGDNPDAMLVGIVVGAVLMAFGSAGLGLWLFREEPVVVDVDDRLAA